MQKRRWTTAATVALLSLGVFGAPAEAAPRTSPIVSTRVGSAPASKDHGSGNSDVPRAFGPGTVANPAPTVPPRAGADERAPLTAGQVQAQVAEATRLQEQLTKDDAQLAVAGGKLAELAAASNTRMNAVTEARAAEDAARQAEKRATVELGALTKEVAAARADLDGMAYSAYVNGSGMLGHVAALVDLVGSGGARADAAAKADYLAKARSADEEHYARLAAEQRRTAASAAAARARSEAAAAEAEKAQKAAADAVKQQQAAVAELQKLTGERRARLEALGVDGGMLAGVDLATLGQVTTTPLCTEEKVAHPNGQWPGSALCALRTAPGHMLRPSAARAYDAMSAAYATAHRAPLCVTDSYRSLAAQIDVKRRKPTLAATPGTSNHGLGLAVDLCGGIESFGTPQYIWMKQHAPLFGFYHPGWAEPTGSKPEPWHWEFAG
ncbi:M15 family metallopeptidase [Mobilicoccus pelagius]|uniref:D-alanyl-D-alanine carboxypeptidase-like core domain-containing protein n=1 Tax=Mobilicoccus pelagius NBRC 104925 TaxID=1089455 RepID=H5UTE4_9MICO|nr:M15 family metallopeptidase [Mobilicoccus pelagius]GAB49002.1 hypothetical protein MOPEL_096_00090 [Mobilicoccus pelagius NBRC 104925]